MWRALSLYWAFCKYWNVQFWSCSSKVFYCCLLTRLKSIVNFAFLPQISGEFSFNRKAHSKRYLFRTEKKIWGSWHVTSTQKLWKNVVKFDQFDKKNQSVCECRFCRFWHLLTTFGIFWHLSNKWSLCQFNAIFLRNSASSFHWLSSSIFTVCSFVPHR